MNNLTLYVLLGVLTDPSLVDERGVFSEAVLRAWFESYFEGAPPWLRLFVMEALKSVDSNQLRYHVKNYFMVLGENEK